MKSISYFGVRRSGITMKVSLNKHISEPTALEMGIVIPTGLGKSGIAVAWGDVVVCVIDAMAKCPQMRLDLRTAMEELYALEAKEYTTDDQEKSDAS